MAIRIDQIFDGSKTVVCVPGRLSSPAAAQLKKTCDPIKTPFVIDLSNLLFADDKGINAIQTIANRGAQIYGASPFIQLLLENASGCKTSGAKLKSTEKSLALIA